MAAPVEKSEFAAAAADWISTLPDAKAEKLCGSGVELAGALVRPPGRAAADSGDVWPVLAVALSARALDDAEDGLPVDAFVLGGPVFVGGAGPSTGRLATLSTAAELSSCVTISPPTTKGAVDSPVPAAGAAGFCAEAI